MVYIKQIIGFKNHIASTCIRDETFWNDLKEVFYTQHYQYTIYAFWVWSWLSWYVFVTSWTTAYQFLGNWNTDIQYESDYEKITSRPWKLWQQKIKTRMFSRNQGHCTKLLKNCSNLFSNLMSTVLTRKSNR